MVVQDKNLLELLKISPLTETLIAYTKYKTPLLSFEEAQEFLGIKTRSVLRNLIEKGDIPARKVGGRIKISLVDLNNYLKKDEVFY